MSAATLLNHWRSDLWCCRGRSVSKKISFIADQRGAVAFESLFVYMLMVAGLLLPLADAAIAGLKLNSAYQALRAFGQSIQYAPPPDITNASGWTTSASVIALANATNPPIGNIQLRCGDSNIACSSTNTVSPKYYSYTTTVTLAPIVLRLVLCTSGNVDPCTYTLAYSERFQ
jgi:hypothetical protein